MSDLKQAFRLAVERYAQWGVDVQAAIDRVDAIPISIHCWQGDDVGGFENRGGALGGGLAVTGAYPGKARTPDQLRSDLEQALDLLPGAHRFNLHASYLDAPGPVERDEITFEHFQPWVEWAVQQQLGIDFNPTYFSHPHADDGFTLAHPNPAIRKFWIDHGIACRQIGAAIGEALDNPCITNFWIPDGYKDVPVDRKSPRERLAESLDAIFAEPIDPQYNRDAVESKLFGIGSESYVVGSHEFYLGYAIANGKVLCLDAGHFHPTEVISDKISAVLCHVDELLLHVSRGVRWDSDHIVVLSDELLAIAQEIVRGDYLPRVHVGLDFFDASVNRVAAWVLATRATRKALLAALLEPIERLRQAETDGDYTARLAWLEEQKTLPLGAVWDYYCHQADIPGGMAWLDQVRRYERDVLSTRT